MPKIFQTLIIVWTLVCLSGLGIFLFQIFGPSIVPQTGYDNRSLTLAIIFFGFLWLIPVAIIVVAGRRHGSGN